jgi:hypothetical protein
MPVLLAALSAADKNSWSRRDRMRLSGLLYEAQAV